MLAFPYLLLALIIVAALGPSLTNSIIAIGIIYTPQYARLMRGQVLSVEGADYVWAARSVGAGRLRVMLRHVLPNSMSPVLVMATLQSGSVIVDTAGLSFLGLGRSRPRRTGARCWPTGTPTSCRPGGSRPFPGWRSSWSYRLQPDRRRAARPARPAAAADLALPRRQPLQRQWRRQPHRPNIRPAPLNGNRSMSELDIRARLGLRPIINVCRNDDVARRLDRGAGGGGRDRGHAAGVRRDRRHCSARRAR